MTTTRKPRRWFQFRLRTLLVLMLLVCIGMGWLGVKMQKVRKQRAAIEAIERLGGSVHWSSTDVPEESAGQVWLRKLLGDDFFAYPEDVEINNDAAMEYPTELTHVTILQVFGSDITDAGLNHLQCLPQLEELWFADTRVTGNGLRHLKGLAQLNTLVFSGTPVTDAGLEHIKGLTQLESLDLKDTQVTDAGLANLRQLTDIEILCLKGTRITDAGFVHLRGLKRLTHLFLDGTQVTDAALVHLKGLTQLQYVQYHNTQVTRSGTDVLRQALPNCLVVP